MNNFELWDNLFQITALFIAIIVYGIIAIKYRSRRFVALVCDHSCFMLGTIFYTLHLIIMGDIPRIFYVSDIAWIAAYLFLLLMMVLRTEKFEEEFELKLLPSIFFILICCATIYAEVVGPSKIMSLCIGLICGATVYLSVLEMYREFKQNRKIQAVDIMVDIRIILQIILYEISDYMNDFVNFNLYFAIDIMLTLNMVGIGYFLRKEEISNGKH